MNINTIMGGGSYSLHNEATGATFSIGKSMPAEYAIFTISKALKVFLCATKPSTNVAFLSQHKISHINTAQPQRRYNKYHHQEQAHVWSSSLVRQPMLHMDLFLPYTYTKLFSFACSFITTYSNMMSLYCSTDFPSFILFFFSLRSLSSLVSTDAFSRGLALYTGFVFFFFGLPPWAQS